MTHDPNHPLVPVVRRVLYRSGIIGPCDGTLIEVETHEDDTDTDEMTLSVHVTKPGTATVTLGPMTAIGQGSVTESEWQAAWRAEFQSVIEEWAADAVKRMQRDEAEEATLRQKARQA
jgi:hypothetical protein